MEKPEKKDMFSDICLLYELSLSVGHSLDLKTDCEYFLRTLMARKNLSAASVWVKASCQISAPRDADPESYILAYSSPEFRIRERILPKTHRLVRMLQDKAVFSISSSGKDFKEIVTEHGIDHGVFAVFALNDLGFLKLYSMTRRVPFDEVELNQLRNVLAKFTVSLEACLGRDHLLREIAERRIVEEALRQSEEKYRDVVERATDGIVIIQEGLIRYANRQLAAMAGLSPAEIIGTSFDKYVHPKSLPQVMEFYRRRVAGQHAPPVYETVLMSRSGEPIHAELNAGLITYEGKPADLVIVRNTTERIRADAEKARLTLAVEQTADSVIITDPTGIIQYVNPAFERMAGYSRAEAMGKTPRLLKSGKQDRALYEQLWRTLRGGQVWRGRLQNRRKDGGIYICDVTITPTRNENGEIINFLGVQRDVTRELQMEEQYLQAQKMESIGRLAGGIAHDFNNIMTAVLGFGSMVLDQLPDNHPLRHAVEQIVSAGERATNLTRQLLTFSRKQMMEIRVLDINAVVNDMNQLLRRALGEDIELLLELNEDAGSVKADAGLLQQVVMNLAINARDAMPRGGRLTILTSQAVLDERFCRSRIDVKPGDYILLSVKDNGTGMPPEVLQHVFEPFFTTKPKGKGTGLGLATVYGIVRQCNGHVEIETAVNEGTEIKVWLPRVEPISDTLHVELEDRVQRGSETILVVEDEPIVRDLTIRILKSLGYRVLDAGHGREALELIAKYTQPIHLVLTDVVMPQMGGPELAEKLAELKPTIKILFTSGFTESAVMERGVALGKLQLVQKPYTREILAQRIRQILDSP